METTAKERLIKFLKYKGIGQNKFEKACGLSIGYLSKLRKEPSPTKLRSIINTYPELSEAWLLTGEGSMLQDVDVVPTTWEPEKEYFSENNHGNKYYKDAAGQLYIEVPLVSYAALGSPDDEYGNLVPASDDRASVSFRVNTIGHGAYYAFEVDGDSMDDGSRRSFERGDLVLVRELDRDDWAPRLHIAKWPFWVVCWNNNVRLKEIIAQDGDTITLHSLNPSPEYTDFQLQLADVRRLFNVIQLQPKVQIFR